MVKNHMHGMRISPDATFGHSIHKAKEAAKETSGSYVARLAPTNGFVTHEPSLLRQLLDWLGL